MNIQFDKHKQPKQPRVYLGSPNNTIICALNGIDEDSFNLQLNVNNTHEISFNVNRYILVEKDGIKKEVESNGYSFLSILLRIYVENIGWFIMKAPSVENDGMKEYKSITATSAEIEMQQHDLKHFKVNTGTTDSYEMLVEENVEMVGDVEFAKEQIKFYNPEKPELSFLDIVLKVSDTTGWKIGYIDNIPKKYKYYENGEYKEKEVKLADEIGTFDVDTQDLYSFLTQNVAQFFSCIFVFDVLNFTINAYRPENFGKNTNINIGFRNLQNSNSISVDEDIYTRYYVQGSNDLGITYINFGKNTIENISYFKNEKYMSSELIEKYNLWEIDLEEKRLIYIENTRLYNSQQKIISELYNRVPLDDCSTDWSTFPDDKLLEAQANYKSQLKGYESFYVDEDGNFDEEALKKSPDANDYYQIKDVILPSIQIEIDNRNLPSDADPNDYIDTYKTDWKLYGLDELQVNLDIYKNNKKLAEEAKCTEPFNPETSTQTEDYHNKMYELYKEAVNQLDANFVGSCQEAYNKRKSEIDDATAIQKQYDDIRKDCLKYEDKTTWKHIKDNVEYSFTEKDLKVLSKLYIDCDYTNENMFTVDSDDAVTAIDEQLKLLDAAQNELFSSSQPQYTYNTSLDNFLALIEYKDYIDNLNLGDFIFLGIRNDYVIKLRVMSISYNPLKMDNNLDITFSNMIQSRASRDDFVYLLNSSSNHSKNSVSGNGNDYLANEGVGLTSGLIQKLLASGAFLNQLNQIINNGSIIVPGCSVSLTELNSKMIKVLDLFAENGFFEYLQAKLITADKIVAGSGEFKDLSALVAMIDNLIAGNVSAELGHIIHLTAESVSIDEAVIRNLIASQITVSMLKAGEISANKFNIKSDDGGLEIVGNTMKFKDSNGVLRIQIGRDTKDNFTFCLYDETGKGVLIDSTGIKESAISDGLIVNDMIANGTLGKEKMDFEILETDENGNIIQNGKVVVDKQGIDAEFTTIKNSVTNIQGQIDNLGETLPSAMNVVLGNESQSIPCNSNGYTLESLLIEIPFLGYAGLNKTPVTAKLGVLPNGITIGEIKNSTVDQDGLITLNVGKNVNLGNENTLSGKIPITFTIKDRIVSKSFYWTKAKSGEDGVVKLYELSSSLPVLSKDINGEINPNNIIFSSTVRNSNETYKDEYSGLFVIKESVDGVKYNTKYTSEKNEFTTTYTLSSNNVISVQCVLCEADNLSNELDIVTIPVLSNEGLKQEITNIKSQISGVSTKVDAVEKSITDKVWQSDITTEINNYDNTSVKTIRDQVSEQKTEIGKISSAVSDVQSTLTTKADGSVVQELTDRVAKDEQDADGFKQTVKNTYATNDKVDTLESTFTQKAGEIEQKVQDNLGNISSLTTSVNGIKGQVEDMDGNISSLTQTSEELKGKLENAQGDITELKGTADGLTADVKNAKEDIASLELTAEGLNVSVSKKQDVHLMSIRYIRDWLNGNSIDTNNYFVECKIFNGETNIAKGILPTLKDQLGTPVEQPANLNIYTDDDFNIKVDEGEKDFIDGGTGLKYLELDLGESMKNIDSIQVWHYYLDGRNYNHKLEVSDNGTDWITLFDSSVQSGYEEKSDGRIYYISESSISSQFSKFDVNFDEIKGQITDTNNIIADLKLSTEGFETSITNHEKQLEDFKNDVNEQIKDVVTDAELDTKLSVELGKINTLIKETQGDLTKLSETIQTSDGWKALFAQIGMYDMPEVVTSVLLSSIGITVTNELTGTKTKMTTDGFSGWYNPTPQDGTDGTRVFALDKDVAITSRLYVDNGIDCNTIKILPQKYNNKGAIVFVKAGGSS